jgi:hypothetical protein
MRANGLVSVGAILSLLVLLILIILPTLAHAMPAECARTDAAISEKVRQLTGRHDPSAVWLLSYSLSSLKMARGLCLGQQPEQAQRIYAFIATALEADTGTFVADQQLGQATLSRD